MKDKTTFKRVWRQVGENKFAEYHIHNGVSSLYGYCEKPPFYAKKSPSPEERAAAKRAKAVEDAMAGYQRRRAAADFDSIRERMIKVAEGDPELLEKLNSDPEAFCLAHDSIRLDELTARHNERMEKIRERQLTGSGRDKGDADVDVILAHEEFHAERERIQRGEYQAAAPPATEEEE